jgi:hypothetical protein
MKISEKISDLLDNGIKPSTLSNLTESQLNVLYSRLVESKKKETKEAVTKTSTTTTYDLSNSSDVSAVNKALAGTANIDPNQKKMIITKEGEIAEKFESKKQQKYFFARCNDETLSKKEKNKWCKMADEFAKKTTFDKLPEVKKEESKEGYLDMVGKAFNKTMQNKISDIKPGLKFESELEKRIMMLVEKHISPRMSKQDFLNTITNNIMIESETVPSPVKPGIKTPTKPKKDNPYAPKPGIKPAPKASKDELPDWLSFDKLGIKMESKIMESETAPSPVKPGIKTPTKPKKDNPYAPKPGIKPAPKAGKNELPDWLSFNKLGIKF